MRRPLISLLTVGFLGGTLPVQAATSGGPSAQTWFENCTVYMNVMAGKEQGSDAELSYCLGQTEGIITGLQTGVQIGAIAFAGVLTVEAGMNEKAVFELFQRTTAENLLKFCLPADMPTGPKVEAIYRHFQRNPQKNDLPATALVYDSLQEAFPCKAASAGKSKPK
jgi:hypothetical protein